MWGVAIRRALAAVAAIVVLSTTSGCMVEAMYAVPIALDRAARTIARALPVDEQKYIVHSTRMPPGEPALARVAKTPPSAAALADAAEPQQAQTRPPSAATASPSPAVVTESPAPIPTLGAAALARRTRL